MRARWPSSTWRSWLHGTRSSGGSSPSSEVVAYLRSPPLAVGGLGTRWTPGHPTIRETRAKATKESRGPQVPDLSRRGATNYDDESETKLRLPATRQESLPDRAI